MKSLIRQYRAVLFIVLTLVVWGVFLYYVSPTTLIEGIGIENSYFVSFVISLLAGFSTFSGGAAYAAVIEFARGGSNPLYLGLASGVGLFLSDSFFYLLIKKGRDSIEARFHTQLARWQAFLERTPTPLVYFITYLFCAFGPIPNDIILGLLLVADYKYRRFWPVLLAGDVTFMLFLSYVFQQ